MIKGQTKSGIEFTLDERIKDDTRFLYFMRKIKDESIDAETRGGYIVDMLTLIFGTDAAVINFMDAVATVHGGVCEAEQMLAELHEMFDALNVKNSSSSQAS